MRGRLSWKRNSDDQGLGIEPNRGFTKPSFSPFVDSTRPGAFSRFPHLSVMLKRRASGPKTSRKKKKGNATYVLGSLDSSDDDDKVAVEDVRVWDISTSEKTGRMTASRKILKHYSQVLLPEEPSTSKELGTAEEVASAEDPGNFADSEFPPDTAGRSRPKPKRKRVRVVKENDSVSDSLVSPPL